MTASGDGLVPPLNAPQAGQVSYGIPPNSNGVIVARQVIVFGPAGNASGVFVYAAGTTPGLGNPPITWESSGLVDPFGNVLPSTTGVAGTGTFQAGDTVINPAGEFVYSAAPAAGDILASIANAAGNDQFGNAYKAGIFVYGATGAAGGLAVSGTQVFLFMYPPGTVHAGAPPQIGSVTANPGAVNELVELGMNSGTETGPGGNAGVQLFSQTADGTGGARGSLIITGAQIVDWFAGSVLVHEPMYAVQPGTGSTQEGWHAMAFAAGYTGTGRYKLLPDNLTVMVESVGSVATNGTVANGTNIWVPPAGYVPNAGISQQMIGLAIGAVGAGSAVAAVSPFAIMTPAGLLVENIATQVATTVRFSGTYALD
jgi:hypothetical protein